jgi:hypothetical protein
MQNSLIIKVGYWFSGEGRNSLTSFELIATYQRFEEVPMQAGEKLSLPEPFRVSTCINVTNLMNDAGEIWCREMVAKVQPNGNSFGPFKGLVQRNSSILKEIAEAAKRLEKLGFQKLD